MNHTLKFGNFAVKGVVNRLQSYLKGKTCCVSGNISEELNELVRVNESERPAEKIDTATPALARWHLNVNQLDVG
ncbi:hypothetical protein D9M71_774980 [compost metagenome]